MASLEYRHAGADLDPETTVSVDGDAPGRLHLSHWPGNRTPGRFRHDLSTGMCLKVAGAPDRDQILAGFETVTNTHWDTDGLLSVFVLMNPELALRHQTLLLDAARAGDMSVLSSESGLKLDLTLTELTRRPGSPVASSRFSDDRERRQAQYEYGLELLPKLLENPDLHADWFAREFWTIQNDLRFLEAEPERVTGSPAHDLAFVLADRHLHETAVNTATGADRIMQTEEVAPGRFRHDFRLTTLSWFDLPSRAGGGRKDWAPLRESLGRKTGLEPSGRWIADDLSHPTPHLRFAATDGEPLESGCPQELLWPILCRFYGKAP